MEMPGAALRLQMPSLPLRHTGFLHAVSATAEVLLPRVRQWEMNVVHFATYVRFVEIGKS